MSRFNTGNPLGSGDPRDLDDNAKNMDLAVNSDEPSWRDRFGRDRKSFEGMEREFDADQAYREARFNDFISASGYQFLGDYAAGIEFTEYNQLVRDENGEFWRLSGQVELPYTTTGSGIPEDYALVPAGDAVLRQDLANPDKGAAMVAVKSPLARAVSRSVSEKLSEWISVTDFDAVGDGITPCSDVFINAWVDAPEGSTIHIPPGEYLLEKTTVLPRKALNVHCEGTIVIDEGSWVGLIIGNWGDPDLIVPGTALARAEAGQESLEFITPPEITPEDYFCVFESEEDLVTRVGSSEFTPYKKIESHFIVGGGAFMLSDPLLYDYDLSLLSIRFYKKSIHTKVEGLRILVKGAEHRTALSLGGLSNVTFDRFNLRQEENSSGIGVNARYNTLLGFSNSTIDGYNVGGETSYPFINFGSSFVHFDGYTTTPPSSGGSNPNHRSYSARHGNQVSFENSELYGVDDHYGSNYLIADCSLRNSISWAGKNIEIRNVEDYSHRPLLLIRRDTPSCSGHLRIKGIRLHNEGTLFSFNSEDIDPLGRTTPAQMFDTVDIDDIAIHMPPTYGAGRFIDLNGTASSAYQLQKTSEFHLSDVRARRFASGTFVYLGFIDIDYMDLSVIDISGQEATTGGAVGTRALPVVPKIGTLRMSKFNACSAYLRNCDIRTIIVDDCIVDERAGIDIRPAAGVPVTTVIFKDTEILNDIQVIPPLDVFVVTEFEGTTFRSGAHRFPALSRTALARSRGNVVAIGGTAPEIFSGDQLREYVNPDYYTDSLAGAEEDP